jgi:hypothetical protein
MVLQTATGSRRRRSNRPVSGTGPQTPAKGLVTNDAADYEPQSAACQPSRLDFSNRFAAAGINNTRTHASGSRFAKPFFASEHTGG